MHLCSTRSAFDRVYSEICAELLLNNISYIIYAIEFLVELLRAYAFRILSGVAIKAMRTDVHHGPGSHI